MYHWHSLRLNAALVGGCVLVESHHGCHLVGVGVCLSGVIISVHHRNSIVLLHGVATDLRQLHESVCVEEWVREVAWELVSEGVLRGVDHCL